MQDTNGFDTTQRQGPTYQELLGREKVSVPDYLRISRTQDMGNEDLPVSRYLSREFHLREKRHVWSRVWQMAGRVADVAEPGDHIVYDNADASLIIVRDESGQLHAFVNSCLHRGRALRTEDGRVSEFRCPYHAFTWGLDGQFKGMPGAWDFKHLCGRDMTLARARVDTWGGFVFVNLDPDAPSLQSFLGVVPEHFARFALHDSYKGIHMQKPIPCNWKLAHEAFLEAYHAIETHPQILPYTDEANTQYDILGPHVTRMMTARGATSPHASALSEPAIAQTILDAARFVSKDGPGKARLAEGVSAREFIGEQNREAYQAAFGISLADATWAELEDAILYDVFPNIQIWAGYNRNIIYQFRPNGDDHESCLFDMMILYRYPVGTAMPPSVPVHKLAMDVPVASYAELGALGPILDQDLSNLNYMTQGLKASRKGAVSLGTYQEARIRHLHATLDAYMRNAGTGDNPAA